VFSSFDSSKRGLKFPVTTVTKESIVHFILTGVPSLPKKEVEESNDDDLLMFEPSTSAPTPPSSSSSSSSSLSTPSTIPLGNVVLFNQDLIVKNQCFLKCHPPKQSVNLLITDIPYNVNFSYFLIHFSYF